MLTDRHGNPVEFSQCTATISFRIRAGFGCLACNYDEYVVSLTAESSEMEILDRDGKLLAVVPLAGKIDEKKAKEALRVFMLSKRPNPRLSRIIADVRRLATTDQSRPFVDAINDTDGMDIGRLRSTICMAMLLSLPYVSRTVPIKDASPMWIVNPGPFCDSDHSGDPLLSLHAAFLASKGGN